MTTQASGVQTETRVSQLLQRQGWHLLERNWSCRWGELDLVLHKNRQLLVVEVKGRRSPAWGPWSVDPAKRRRLGRAISCWRTEHPMQAEWLLQVGRCRGAVTAGSGCCALVRARSAELMRSARINCGVQSELVAQKHLSRLGIRQSCC